MSIRHTRRRRAIYAAGTLPTPPGRRADAMRDRPAAGRQYGTRVRRPLARRVYASVPLRRQRVVTLAAALVIVAASLTAGHVASVQFDGVIPKPLGRIGRLDRPDSLGGWWVATLWTITAAAAAMIYALRRHRNDDFVGAYRVWRWAAAASLAGAMQQHIDWIAAAGSIPEWAFGPRIGLTGSDWVRMVWTLALAVLGLRVVVDARRCRTAWPIMVAGGMLAAIPESLRWHLWTLESRSGWFVVTSAPLFAATAGLIGSVMYLRMQIRSALGHSEPWRPIERLRQSSAAAWSKVAESRRSTTDDIDEPPTEATPTTPRVRRSRTRKPDADQLDTEELEREHGIDDADEGSDASEPAIRRRWFRRKPKSNPSGVREKTESAESSGKYESSENSRDGEGTETDAEAPTTEASRRRWFGLRRRPKSTTDPAEADAMVDEDGKDLADTTASDDETTETRSASDERRPIWKRWRRRSTPPNESDVDEGDEPVVFETDDTTNDAESSEPANDADEPNLDPSDIDWSGLSKSERRRLKKQLRRQNRAA